MLVNGRRQPVDWIVLLPWTPAFAGVTEPLDLVSFISSQTLRMRIFLNATKGIPHPEEVWGQVPADRLEGRTAPMQIQTDPLRDASGLTGVAGAARRRGFVGI